MGCHIFLGKLGSPPEIMSAFRGGLAMDQNTEIFASYKIKDCYMEAWKIPQEMQYISLNYIRSYHAM